VVGLGEDLFKTGNDGTLTTGPCPRGRRMPVSGRAAKTNTGRITQGLRPALHAQEPPS